MGWVDGEIAPRLRVITDNDYAGDPDGLVQLAHHLLCPTVDLVAVVGGQKGAIDPSAGPESAEDSADAARVIAALARRPDVRIVAGSNQGLASRTQPRVSDAATVIVEEAMRDDTEVPLVVACGGSLTNVASALLLEPRIAERLTVVWIGGGDHPDLGEPRTTVMGIETNVGIDIPAAQVVFDSTVPLWQFPMSAYSQPMVSRPELELNLRPRGELGAYLYERIAEEMETLEGYGFRVGDAYIFGDSPLVSATVLTARFSNDPGSCTWVTRPRPAITDDGGYDHTVAGAAQRIFTRVDTRALVADLFARLELLEAMS